MAYLDRESMPEDIKKRIDALSDFDHMIVDWLVEVWDYSLEDAVDMVEKGTYFEYAFCEIYSYRRRWDALNEDEQCAVAAIVETGDYGIEDALIIVSSAERGKQYDFYPDIMTMADLARKLVREEDWYDPYTVEKLDPYIDYDKLGEDLYTEGYCDTSYGVVRVWD